MLVGIVYVSILVRHVEKNSPKNTGKVWQKIATEKY